MTSVRLRATPKARSTSNFGTLDELFLALYREQSREFAEHTVRFLAAEPFDTVEATIQARAQALPINRDWLLINTDFVLYAARLAGCAIGTCGGTFPDAR